MAAGSEPRALTAALSSPAFVTRGGGAAVHAANRHVERWAPESTVARQGSLKSLGFVDRLVSPWLETAQRSASIRMFQQMRSTGFSEREGAPVSWVFPRPWYQDELDWMAAARQTTAATATARQAAPSMLTTRGTFVAPQMPRIAPQASASGLPPALYEYVAPSLSIAGPQSHVGAGAGGRAMTLASERVFSPLVPYAAAQAAHVMSRAMGPLQSAYSDTPRFMTPGLRAVLATMLERSARTQQGMTTDSRRAEAAPHMVTPPAPRADDGGEQRPSVEAQIAADMAVQRSRIAELQRIARQIADREVQQRAATSTSSATPASSTQAAQPASQQAPSAASRVAPTGDVGTAQTEQARIEQRIAERLAEREAQTRAQAAAQQAQQVERQRRDIEEKIAQATTRTQAARLHEQSREAAVRDARAAAEAQIEARVQAAQAQAAQAQAAQSEARVPPELAAALAALPPEMAGYIGRRPERAVHAINELGQALHAVELLARNAARGGSVESARGPRLAMPAGLGGLVAMVDRAMPVEQLQAQLAGQPQRAPIAATAGAMPMAARASAARVPALQMLLPPNAAARTGAPTALAQTAAATPAALHHVAWADRWLARFAGARPQSLDAMSIAGASSPQAQLAALAEAAPGAVWVAPSEASGVRLQASGSETAVPTNAAGVALRNITQPQIVRIDDDDETPDSVFAAISQAASQSRPAPAPASGSSPDARRLTPDASSSGVSRETYADFVAHSAPHAPDAGLAAQLASSPFAPALRHILPLASAPTFDVRALFGGGLAATYLAGLIAPEAPAHSIAGAQLPQWASWSDARAQALATAPGAIESTRDVADWSPSYVAPEQPAIESGEPAATAATDSSFDVRAAQTQLTTLRSALLSYEIEQRAGAPAELRASAPQITEQVLAATSPGMSPTVARSMIQSMSLPMIGDATLGQPLVAPAGAEHAGTAFAAPGMIADRAQAWSVAQERSSSDLALDFVPPELVLAARVYGLGPAEAAQAARLAIAGPSQLAAMASAVDRTFIQAMAMEREKATGARRQAPGRTEAIAPSLVRDFATVYPTASGELVGGGTAPSTAATASTAPAFQPSATSFGIERRAPRGAFLWPSGTVAALGMNAPVPDGDHATSVAALELLAAQSVAELGTFAAFGGDERPSPAMAAATSPTGAPGATKEEDVLASVTAMVPEARRSKFEALYLALGQSPVARGYTPAARAARALALAGRGEETISARERASIAWDVLPTVYAAAGESDHGAASPFDPAAASPSLSTGAASAKASQRRAELREAGFVEMRPGLGTLSARAGEALGSYVAPTTAASADASATSAASGSRGATPASRAPSAAPELVRTGRATARHGGGEVEIPAWFEAAAKRMFSDRSGSGSVAEDISIAELTLVQAAPSGAIAASSRAMPSTSQPPADSPRTAKEEHKIDVERVAQDVFKHVQTMMDSARARNGEPYL